MSISLSRIAIAMPAIGLIAFGFVTDPGHLGSGLIRGLCWFSLVYGIIATREFRRSSVALIVFLYLWAGSILFTPNQRSFLPSWEIIFLVVGLVLMALHRTPGGSSEPSDGTPADVAQQYYYVMIDNEVKGPFTLRDLVLLKRQKIISKETLCCVESTEDWIPFSEV